MATHFLYIDDSGTKEYAERGETYGRGGGKSRYFVFGGVLLPEPSAGILGEQIAETKRFFFGTENVEIKSNWLRFPAERERRYLQPFSLSEAALKNFVDEYYEIVAKADLQLIVAVVDKQHVQEVYEGKPLWYAPAIAYEVLMQRVVQEVPHPDRVSVYIDDMTGATPAGNQYKANLRNHHKQLVS